LLAGAAILLGGGVAWLTSRQVAMTAMPQMVALFNGLGGGAAALIVVTQLLDPASLGGLALGFGLLALTIGTLSFGGSLVAFTKLAGRLRHPWRFRYQNSLHLIWLGLIVLVGAGFFILSEKTDLTAIFVALALGLGISTTVPIGGADMPVVISFYNALTGLAVGVDGLLLKNPALLIAGTVVGASGTLLTRLMAKAMNRSLGAVLFAHFGSITATGTGEGTASKEMDLTDAAVSLAYARKIRIVPGYDSRPHRPSTSSRN
ncbi:NAD(P)(+) transhydrogenase (AB-specific), partial [mine drainage metagenome]